MLVSIWAAQCQAGVDRRIWTAYTHYSFSSVLCK